MDDVDKPLKRRTLEDGRILELWRMLFNLRITVAEPSEDGFSFSDMWCYRSPAAALVAFERWNGEGEPDGWVKHPPSGRRRPDGTPASEQAREE